MSALEDTLLMHISGYEMPPPEREYRFHPKRKWRFDLAWPERKIAAEVEGATWANGRHTRGSGFEADCEKYNTAALLGWTVYRFTGKMIESGDAIDTIRCALGWEWIP